jgi:hypothetical protein
VNAGDRDGDFVVTTSSEQHNKTISTAEKPNPSSSSELKKSFIKSKYVTRKFVKSMSAAASVSLLYSAATTGDLTGMLVAIAAGADINYHHPDNGLMTALHACCINGHVLSVELLCLFNASVDEKDSQDKTPLDYVDNDEGDSALIMDILIQKLERDLQ